MRLGELKERLEAKFGVSVSDEELRNSIRLFNKERELMGGNSKFMKLNATTDERQRATRTVIWKWFYI